MRDKTGWLLKSLAGVLVFAGGVRPAMAVEPITHLTRGEGYVIHYDGNPEDNSYGTPAFLEMLSSLTESSQAQTRCGSFVARLLDNTYVMVDAPFLESLTGLADPYSEDWYDAIVNERHVLQASPTPPGVFDKGGFSRVRTEAEIKAGDIVAIDYNDIPSNYIPSNSLTCQVPSDTGHTFMVASNPAPVGQPYAWTYYECQNGNIVENVDTSTQVQDYSVKVIDSSAFDHSNDTRTSDNDQGIGSGWMRFQVRVSDNKIVGYKWSDQDNTTSTYRVTESLQSGWRSLAVGRLSLASALAHP